MQGYVTKTCIKAEITCDVECQPRVNFCIVFVSIFIKTIN